MEILSRLEWIGRNTTSWKTVAWVKSSDGWSIAREPRDPSKIKWSQHNLETFPRTSKKYGKSRNTIRCNTQDIHQGGVNPTHETKPLIPKFWNRKQDDQDLHKSPAQWLPGLAHDRPEPGVRIKIYVAPFCQWQNNQADSGRSHYRHRTLWILKRFNSFSIRNHHWL